MTSFEFAFPTRLIFGSGTVNRIGEVTRGLDCSRPLLVADPGIRDAGHVDTVLNLLTNAGLNVEVFDQFGVNPDSTMVDRGVSFATSLNRDSIIGLGGGSSLDCAKGINLILMNGGQIADYRGYGHAQKPLLPMVAIPTTAGTGSEAQSYAVISDSTTHLKMACGDQKLAFSTAILDPELTLSQPAQVTAAAGFDAIAHAVETAVTTRRTTLSMLFSKEAFRLLNANYERVLTEPNNLEARGAMHLGAFYAGVAIEQSMLGAAHACANPLTAQYQLTHGVALAILLPHVVRWNTQESNSLYAELMDSNIPPEQVGTRLTERLVELSKAGGFPADLKTAGIPMSDLGDLAESAGAQWTGTFNPRPFSESDALEVYQCAY
jgi:alcohol dehydrogenase